MAGKDVLALTLAVDICVAGSELRLTVYRGNQNQIWCAIVQMLCCQIDRLRHELS